MRAILVLSAICLLTACEGVRTLPAPPAAIYEDARVIGFPGDIRIWGDTAPDDIAERVAEIRAQIGVRVQSEGAVPNDGSFDVLVLSGGGSDGAFGAGLLNGWSVAGGRPEFGIVTGISTGALLAPYAFLGEQYDGQLERLFTNTETDDLLIMSPVRALFGRSLAISDNTPLKQIVQRALSPDVIRGIAAEHRKGRRLWIGTTNLDAQRPVIWDIGAIAAAGGPRAKDLIRDILLASSAIPGALPPIQIQVDAGGKRYSEMHVDGGVTRQLFAYPYDLNLNEQPEDDISGIDRGTIWVIRNTKLDPSYAETGAGVVPITTRSVSTLLKAAGVADVQVIEAQARRDGWGLNAVSVPASFDVPEAEIFDPAYMGALYETGYAMATEGDPWEIVVEPPAPDVPKSGS
jgi:predicted acylesterase/phospholipase RssA